MENNKIPLQYFEEIIENNAINKLKQNFIDQNTEFLSNIEKIDPDKGIIVYWDSYYNTNNKESFSGHITLTFENKLSNLLYFEFSKSKKLIDECVLENPTDYLPYLYLQEKTLKYIINRGKQTIIDYPILLKPLLGIQRYINEKYLLDQERKIQLDTTNIKEHIESRLPLFEDSNEIEFTLNYLKGNNDKGQLIMSEENYKKMINYITYFNENRSLPENIEKLPHINISQNLLRFTFWVLHKRLYTTSEIKDEFIHLMKAMFSDFDNWAFSPLKTKFGSREKVTVNGIKFIPDFIKEEVRNRR